jgi:hypothetical protein
MLLKHATLAAITRGEIDVVYRRWKRPTVKAGGTLKTRVGVIAIDAVDRVARSGIKAADARRAGFETRAELLRLLDSRDGDVYRIRVRYAGEDPRIALRTQRIRTQKEADELAARLARMDRASKSGPWTVQYLELIADNEAVRAIELAESLGMEKKPFKARVRRLKALGLTESLEKGYRISPRGKSFLARRG